MHLALFALAPPSGVYRATGRGKIKLKMKGKSKMENHMEMTIVNNVCIMRTFRADGKLLHERKINRGVASVDAPKVKYRREIAQPFTSMGVGTALMVAGNSAVRNVKRGA